MVHRRSKGARHGVAATELAIWLPFLALMFAVAVDFCRAYYTTQVLENCAAVGATYACGVAWVDSTATSNSDAAVQAALAEGASLNPALQAGNIAVSSSGNTTTVTVSYDFAFLTWIPGFGQGATITRTVTIATVPQPGS
jgi:Flp pilus assembly protein TadG